MNKNFIRVFLFSVSLSLVMFTGCETQPSTSSASRQVSVDSELEEKVMMLANTVDPYERYSRNEIYLMLERFMHENPEIYASGFATVSNNKFIEDFNYIYKDGTTFITIDGYDYDSVDEEMREVVVARIHNGENFWSPRYVREDGSGNKVPVNTFFCPILNDSGQIIYVLTVDEVSPE